MLPLVHTLYANRPFPQESPFHVADHAALYVYPPHA
jgi:hypothetical protein